MWRMLVDGDYQEDFRGQFAAEAVVLLVAAVVLWVLALRSYP